MNIVPQATSDCMSVRAVVQSVDSDGEVRLSLAPTRACRGCEGLCLWKRGAQAALALRPSGQVPAVGTEVLVSLPPAYLLLSAVLLHGSVWLGMLLGACLGGIVIEGDWAVLACAVAGAGLFVLVTPGLRRRLERATMAHLKIQAL